MSCMTHVRRRVFIARHALRWSVAVIDASRSIDFRARSFNEWDGFYTYTWRFINIEHLDSTRGMKDHHLNSLFSFFFPCSWDKNVRLIELISICCSVRWMQGCCYRKTVIVVFHSKAFFHCYYMISLLDSLFFFIVKNNPYFLNIF